MATEVCTATVWSSIWKVPNLNELSINEKQEVLNYFRAVCSADSGLVEVMSMLPWVYWLVLAGLIPLCLALIRGKIGSVSQIFIVLGVAFGLYLSTISHYVASNSEQALDHWEETYGGYQVRGFTLIEKAAGAVGISRIVYHMNSNWNADETLFYAPTLRIFCAYAIGLYSLIGSWLFVHFLERRIKFQR